MLQSIFKEEHIMSFKKVVFAGSGVLGTQIAFHAAYCGFYVTI